MTGTAIFATVAGVAILVSTVVDGISLRRGTPPVGPLRFFLARRARSRAARVTSILLAMVLGVVLLGYGVLVLVSIDREEVLTFSSLHTDNRGSRGQDYNAIDSHGQSYNLSASIYDSLQEGVAYRCDVQTYELPITPTLLSCQPAAH